MDNETLNSAPDHLTDEQMAAATGEMSTPGGQSTPSVNPQLATNNTQQSSMGAPDHLTDEEMNAYQDKYGGAGGAAKAFLHGTAQGFAGPLAPMAEKALGIPEEDIRGYTEQHPIATGLGEATGLGTSLMTGTGLGAAAEKAGMAGLGALGITSKLGSAATKAAIENMVIAGSDEVSKAILNDPSSIQDAAVDVGLSGLIGAGFGIAGAGAKAAIGDIPTMWKHTIGKDAQETLEALGSKMGGTESAQAGDIKNAIGASGIEVPEVVQAALTGPEGVRNTFGALNESTSKAGVKTAEALKTFRENAANGIMHALGKAPEEADKLADLSEADIGENIKKSLGNQIKETIEPIASKFEGIKAKYSKEELPDLAKSSIMDKVGQLAADEGYSLSPDFPQGKIINRLMKDVPNLKSVEDLRKYTSVLGDQTYNTPELRRVGGQLKSILRDAEEDVIGNSALTSGANIAEHMEARAAYRQAMNTIDELNDRLHVGRYAGPNGFVKALEEMHPEDVLRRLSPKNDVGALNLLKSQFPGVAEDIRDHYLNGILKPAVKGAKVGVINPNTFFKKLGDMSPELRNFVADPEVMNRLSAIKTLTDALPERMNPSGTAKTLMDRLKHFPEGATAMAAMVLGHNPVAGYLVGHIATKMATEVPDAVKYSILKYLGSSAAPNAEAFKTMAHAMSASMKGAMLLDKTVKSMFKGGVEALPSLQRASAEKDRERLKRQLALAATSPDKMTTIGGQLGHYMPDHAGKLTETAGNAVNYLNSIKPDKDKQNPLDTKRQPSSAEEAKYNRALDIANNPVSVLDAVKKGTITPNDVMALRMMYPDLYNKMSAKILGEMNNTLTKKQAIPYKTRMGLSMFLGQPLDSTMTPMGISAAQPAPKATPQAGQPQAPVKHKTAALTKLSGQYQTKSQAAEADTTSRE